MQDADEHIKFNATWKTTTSGILVANIAEEIFITVASHGFEDDGLIYHPNPKHGKVIGRIITILHFDEYDIDEDYEVSNVKADDCTRTTLSSQLSSIGRQYIKTNE